MTIPELFDPNLRAREAAKQQYERAAMRLFSLEDLYRSAGARREDIRDAHRAGIVAGHAAWAELVDPTPMGI
jgi:hypothetical protein